MIYIKPLLDKSGKKAIDFINWLCDGTRNHDLKEHEGKNLISIKRNGIDGHCYIDDSLEGKFNEFLKVK